MSIDKTKGEIGIYGILKNDTDANVIAYAEQVKDTAIDKVQSDINKEYEIRLEDVERGEFSNAQGKQLSDENFTSELKDKLLKSNNVVKTLPDTIVRDVELNESNDILVHAYPYDAADNSYGPFGDETATIEIPTATTETKGFMSAEDKTNLDDVVSTLETKADVSELSNVLGEEVIDSPLLDEINTLTREEIKKDLFIDMWNQACGKFGTYNAETGYFELNGLTDITYEEALEIYQVSGDRNIQQQSKYRYAGLRHIRTLLPIRELSSGNSVPIESYAMFLDCRNLEVIQIVGHHNDYTDGDALLTLQHNQAFMGCRKLREVRGTIRCLLLQGSIIDFSDCESLEVFNLRYIRNSINICNSSRFNYNSLSFIVRFKQDNENITITVHADVYAKLTGDTANQAAAALPADELAKWQQLVTDAAAKQITFATV